MNRGLPALSVVIPAYGRPDELDRCLASLVDQHGVDGHFEVVVVDDGSPQSLAGIVARYEGTLTVTSIRHEANRGRSAARNTGARSSRGRILLFLDSDMLATSDLVRAHLDMHQGPEGEGTVALGGIPVEPSCRTPLGRYMERRGHMRPEIDPEHVPYRYFVSGNTSLARSLFDQTGGYDEAFVHYGGEDIDLGYRLHLAGARMRVARRAVAYHTFRYEVSPMAARMREFGGLVLPMVFARHPRLRRDFRLDLLDGRGGVTSGLFRFLTLPVFLAVGRLAAPTVGRFLPWIMSYVLVGHYFRGYADYLDGKAREGRGPTR